MKLQKYLAWITTLTMFLPSLASCASAVHLPGAEKSPVLQASAETPQYVSDILGVTETKTHPGEVSEKHGHGPELPYICPMHPDVQSDKPGKCPKCGMKLQLREKTITPKKEKGHEHH